MALRLIQPEPVRSAAAFTLVEVLVAIVILALVISGLIVGYIDANRTAEWSSMSLAAQSYASQGAEQARAADWRPRDPVPSAGSATTGPGTMDELPPTNYTRVDFMDIPSQGSPSSTNFDFWLTNYVSLTVASANPPLRQIRSDCIWLFPLTGRPFTNTVILLRAPDQ